MGRSLAASEEAGELRDGEVPEDLTLAGQTKTFPCVVRGKFEADTFRCSRLRDGALDLYCARAAYAAAAAV